MLSRRLSSVKQTGLSLVELLVGITVGLFIVAAAAMLMATQLGENRKLLLETQLQQDLRATVDIITREVRRAGYWKDAENGVWSPSANPTANTFSEVKISGGTRVEYGYTKPDGAPVPFQYRLDNGVIKTILASNTSEQDLTDNKVMFVKKLEIAQVTSSAVILSCPKSCPAPSVPPNAPFTTVNWCWPTFEIREILVKITGKSLSDVAVERTVSTRTRLRNDHVTFHPSSPAGCPA